MLGDYMTRQHLHFFKIGIWEIFRNPRHLGNFPDTQAFGKFLFLTFLIIVVTPSYGRLVCRNPGVLQITVNPFNLQVLNQTKKIPMILLSSPIKI